MLLTSVNVIKSLYVILGYIKSCYIMSCYVTLWYILYYYSTLRVHLLATQGVQITCWMVSELQYYIKLHCITLHYIMLLYGVTLQPGCKLLYVLARYSRTTNYMCMMCEALHLHRLIVKAFEPPKHLAIYYIIGWGKLCVMSLAGVSCVLCHWMG